MPMPLIGGVVAFGCMLVNLHTLQRNQWLRTDTKSRIFAHVQSFSLAHSRRKYLDKGAGAPVGFHAFSVRAVVFYSQQRAGCFRTVRYLCEDSVTKFVWTFYRHALVCCFFPSHNFCRWKHMEISTEIEIRLYGITPGWRFTVATIYNEIWHSRRLFVVIFVMCRFTWHLSIGWDLCRISRRGR